MPDTEAARAARRARAEAAFLREGMIGMVAVATAAAATHAALTYRRVPVYQNLNWRLKLLIGTAASIAGFAVRSEQAALSQRGAAFDDMGEL